MTELMWQHTLHCCTAPAILSSAQNEGFKELEVQMKRKILRNTVVGVQGTPTPGSCSPSGSTLTPTVTGASPVRGEMIQPSPGPHIPCRYHIWSSQITFFYWDDVFFISVLFSTVPHQQLSLQK